MSEIQINLYKNFKNNLIYEIHKNLLLQTKNCKINNFINLYKTLLFKNQLSQRRSNLIFNNLFSDWIEMKTACLRALINGKWENWNERSYDLQSSKPIENARKESQKAINTRNKGVK